MILKFEKLTWEPSKNQIPSTKTSSDKQIRTNI